jgi:hypothetical protein
MVREKNSVENFKKIAKENEYFLWHFLMEDQHESHHALWSLFDEKVNPYTKTPELHSLKILLSMTEIPYYESYVKDSMDFLMNLGLNGKDLYKLRNLNPELAPDRKWYYVPLVVGFKRTRMVHSTHRVCYCVEGITDIILELNPELILNVE